MDKQDFFNQIKKDKNKIVNRSKKVVLTEKEKNEPFMPEIHENDSCLVVTVKEILQEEKINLKEVQHNFKSAMDMNNCKRSLSLHHTMSFERFVSWMYALGYDWELVVKKRKDKNEEE